MIAIYNFEAGRKQKNSEQFTVSYAGTVKFTSFGGHRNGNIYAGSGSNNNIYLQIAGEGSFNSIQTLPTNIKGFAFPLNGDVYTPTYGGDIYKQTNGTGSFVAEVAGVRDWYGCTANNIGDIYSIVIGGEIYKKTGGVGAWVSQGAGSKSWLGITCDNANNIYAVAQGDGLYKQTNSTGAWVKMVGVDVRGIQQIVFLNGHIYGAECSFNNTGTGSLYVIRNLIGDFVKLVLTGITDPLGLGATYNGALYTSNFYTDTTVFPVLKSPKNAVPPIVTTTFGTIPAKSYGGGTLAPNGKIYSAPLGAGRILIINTLNDTFTTIAFAPQYRGGALAPNGKVYFAPWGSSVLEIDPATDTYSTFAPSVVGAYWGTVLAPNGLLYGVPFNSAFVCEINPIAKTAVNVGANLGGGGHSYAGGTLASNGKIYFAPWDATSFAVFDPTTKAITKFGSIAGGQRFIGAISAPNGYVYYIPASTTAIYVVNPTTNAVSSFGSLPAGNEKYEGAVLGKNGKIYCINGSATQMLEIDPTTNTTKLVGTSNATPYKWSGGALAPNGAIYGIPYDTFNILKVTGTDNPNLMGEDASIPSDISTLATSNYNLYYNHF